MKRIYLKQFFNLLFLFVVHSRPIFGTECYECEPPFFTKIRNKFFAFNCNDKLIQGENYLIAVAVEVSDRDVEIEKINQRYPCMTKMQDATYYQKIYCPVYDDTVTFEQYFSSLYEPYLKDNKNNYYQYHYLSLYFFYNGNMYLGKVKQTPYKINQLALSNVIDDELVDYLNEVKFFLKKDYYYKKRKKSILYNLSDTTFNLFYSRFKHYEKLPKELCETIFNLIVQDNPYFLITAMPLVCKQWNAFWHDDKIQKIVQDIISFNTVISESFFTGFDMPLHFFTDKRFCKNFKIENGRSWHHFFLKNKILYNGCKKNMTLTYINPATWGYVPLPNNTLEADTLLKLCCNYDDNSLDYYYPTLSILQTSINMLSQKRAGYIFEKNYVQRCIAFEHMIIIQILKTSNPFFEIEYKLSLVCKDWYRYLKESSTVHKLENDILYCTDKLAKSIINTFSMDQNISFYLSQQKELLRNIKDPKYDKNRLWKKIKYRKIKDKLFKEDIPSSQYIKYVFGTIFFIENAELLQSLVLKNIADDIVNSRIRLSKLLAEAVSNDTYLEELRENFEFIRRKKYTLANLLYEYIEKNKPLYQLLSEKKSDENISVNNDQRSPFFFIRQAKLLIKYYIDLLIFILCACSD